MNNEIMTLGVDGEELTDEELKNVHGARQENAALEQKPEVNYNGLRIRSIGVMKYDIAK